MGKSWTLLKDRKVKVIGDFDSRTPAWNVERKALILAAKGQDERSNEVVAVESETVIIGALNVVVE
jgi:hypothetical protein